MIVVSDTTPIISLMKAGQLELLQKLFGVVYIPEAVYRELTENEAFSEEVRMVQECEFFYVEEVANSKRDRIKQQHEVLDFLQKLAYTNHSKKEGTSMQKEEILNKLREQGCRITKQRRILLDIILQEEYSCCKEIYYKAIKVDDSIGIATVYRMINTLEEIGAIRRNAMYKIDCPENCEGRDLCQIELHDGTSLELTRAQWNQVIVSGLKACGYQV